MLRFQDLMNRYAYGIDVDKVRITTGDTDTAPVTGLMDLGRYPEGIDETGEAIADAIERVLENGTYAAECAARGIARARTYRWETTAAAVYDAYRQAIEHHAHRH